MNVKKTTETAYNPIFLKILEDIPGGVTISVKDIPSDVKEVKAGTLLCESTTTSGLFNPVKVAKSTKTQTANVSITVGPGHLFKVGEYIAKENGYTSSTISSITHTAATTDTIVTGTAIGALATATKILRCATRSTATSGYRTAKYVAGAILRDNVEVRNDDLSTIYNVAAGAVVRGTVNESLLPLYVLDADKTALTARIRWA